VVAAIEQRSDGRVRRGARNRDAIVDGILSCYGAGILRPTAVEVAERAGVSVRSVHNHFADMESLRAEVAELQWARLAPVAEAIASDGALVARIGALVDVRGALFEAATPVRRAAVLVRHESPTIARNLARAERRLRRQVELVFAPELERAGDARAELLEALDVLTSWETWERARSQQRLSPAAARRVVERTITALLAPHARPDEPVGSTNQRGARR
jgi:AcrR family transcriptional regulator